MDSLTGTENEWVVDLLKTFCYGDIRRFEKLRPIWGKIPDLAAQEVKLRQKISLLCLMEMTCKRPAELRSLRFSEISREAHIPNNEVELLVMKALAQGLIRGAIDQVAGVVIVTWVQPRVLVRDQLSLIVTHLGHWTDSITEMEKLMESKASEILTN